MRDCPCRWTCPVHGDPTNVEVLRDLHEWAHNREHHSGVSDLNTDEARGWNLALSGVAYRARRCLDLLEAPARPHHRVQADDLERIADALAEDGAFDRWARLAHVDGRNGTTEARDAILKFIRETCA